MIYLYFADAHGARLTARQETDRSEGRISLRIVETGELPICEALDSDYDRELAELCEARGWTKIAD